MTASARELLESAREELAPGEHENRLVPLIAQGTASREALAALAAEQHRIIKSDWRSFLVLASRSTDPAAGSVFLGLAEGEVLALEKLAGFAVACRLDEQALRDYKPRDFFASPPPDGDEPALAVVQAGLDAGRGTDQAREYGRLLQSYELMFWNTLAELVSGAAA